MPSDPSKSKPKSKKRSKDSSLSDGAKRRKVSLACVYCRRSHMTCDEERPCQRCVRRGIGHLCHDRPHEHAGQAGAATAASATAEAPAAPLARAGNNSDSPAPLTTSASPDPPSTVPVPPTAPPAAWGMLNHAMGFAPPAQWGAVPPPPGGTAPNPASAGPRPWAYPPTGLPQPTAPSAPAPPGRTPSWFGLPPGQQQWEASAPEGNANEYQMLRYVPAPSCSFHFLTPFSPVFVLFCFFSLL